MKKLGHDFGTTPMGHAQVRAAAERQRQERILGELASWPRRNDGQTLRIPRESGR